MNKAKKFTAVVLCLMMVLGTSFAFADTTPILPEMDYSGHWAEPVIQKWLNEGKVTGYPDGNFKPDDMVTRAEFVKMVNGIIDFDTNGKINYSDVSEADWFYGYVSVAQEIGYIQGYDGKFAPNDNITREQAAAILARIQYLDDNKAAGKFNDISKVSSWAEGSIGAAFDAGFIKGYEDGEFRPQNNLTRAEAITMLDNVQENPKNYVVYRSGAQISNITVKGDFVIAPTVGDGSMILDSATVNGEIRILGSGTGTVTLNNVKADKISVEKEGVKLILGTGTEIQELMVNCKATIENKGSEIPKTVINSNENVTLSGKFTEVTTYGKCNIVLDNAEIKVLTVEKAIDILGKAKIDKFIANVDGIRYEKDVKIGKYELGEGVKSKPTLIKDDQQPSDNSSSSGRNGGGGNRGGETPEEEEYVLQVTLKFPDDNKIYTVNTSKYSDSDVLSDFVVKEATTVLNETEYSSVVEKYIDGMNARFNGITVNSSKLYSEQGWNKVMAYLDDTTVQDDMEDLKPKLMDNTVDKSDMMAVFALYDKITDEDIRNIKENIADINSYKVEYNGGDLKYSVKSAKDGLALNENKAIADFILDQFKSTKVEDFVNKYGKITATAKYGEKEAVITMDVFKLK